jgi:hypothetical protein
MKPTIESPMKQVRFSFNADPDTGLSAYTDALYVDPSTSQKEIERMIADRYARWAEAVLNPPTPEPVVESDALTQALQAVAEAQTALSAAAGALEQAQQPQVE